MLILHDMQSWTVKSFTCQKLDLVGILITGWNNAGFEEWFVDLGDELVVLKARKLIVKEQQHFRIWNFVYFGDVMIHILTDLTLKKGGGEMSPFQFGTRS